MTLSLKIAVVGATGVLGRHLVPRLIEGGHRINALVRTAEASQQLGQMGVAEAFVRALSRLSSQTLAVVDDVPLRYSELFNYVAALEMADRPKPGGPLILESFRVPNYAAKRALNWSPH